MIVAKLNDYRQSPRKVRLVAKLIQGKSVSEAQAVLSLLTKRASAPLLKLLNSAVANAKNNFNIESGKLFVKEFRVDGGAILKRRMQRARGMAYPINKRTSRVFLKLDEAPEKKVKANKKK